MGVMLQRDAQNQRLYLHDVVIEKEASDFTQEHLDSTGPYEENENLYTSSILEKIVEVKRNIKPDKQISDSLSAESTTGQAYGSYNVYGEEVALETQSAGENSTENLGNSTEDLGPVREDLKKAPADPTVIDKRLEHDKEKLELSSKDDKKLLKEIAVEDER